MVADPLAMFQEEYLRCKCGTILVSGECPECVCPCGSGLPKTDKYGRRCVECIEIVKESGGRAGICSSCGNGNWIKGIKGTCYDCRVAHDIIRRNKYTADKYARQDAAGVCRLCDQPRSEGTTHCKEHLAAERKRSARKLAAAKARQISVHYRDL